MEYFEINQDKRYVNPPLISDFFPKFRRQDFCMLRQHKIEDFNVVFTKSEKPSEPLDLLNEQIVLVSEGMHEVFGIYEKSIKYKVFCVLNNKFGQYYYYYAPIFPELDCLLPESYSACNKRHIESVIIDNSKAADNYVFKVTALEREIIIVRLEVLESMLRRDIRKFCYRRVQTR